MDRIENIERYLRAHIAAERRDGVSGDFPSGRSFVTISRQSGTGAHALAESILGTFTRQEDQAAFEGWRVYDRSICEIVARDPKFSRSLDALLEEEYHTRSTDVFHQLVSATADQSALLNRVFLVVRAIAGMGRTIIIGRAGAQVTRDMPHGLSMRLVADDSQRISDAMARFDMTEREARSDLRRRDASRQRMVRDRFGVDIGDPTEYHVTWNVGTATHGEIALAVTQLVRSRAGTK